MVFLSLLNGLNCKSKKNIHIYIYINESEPPKICASSKMIWLPLKNGKLSRGEWVGGNVWAMLWRQGTTIFMWFYLYLSANLAHFLMWSRERGRDVVQMQKLKMKLLNPTKCCTAPPPPGPDWRSGLTAPPPWCAPGRPAQAYAAKFQCAHVDSRSTMIHNSSPDQ